MQRDFSLDKPLCPSKSLRSPVSGLRSPVSGLRSPVSGLRSPVSGLRSMCVPSPRGGGGYPKPYGLSTRSSECKRRLNRAAWQDAEKSICAEPRGRWLRPLSIRTRTSRCEAHQPTLTHPGPCRTFGRRSSPPFRALGPIHNFRIWKSGLCLPDCPSSAGVIRRPRIRHSSTGSKGKTPRINTKTRRKGGPFYVLSQRESRNCWTQFQRSQNYCAPIFPK